MSAHPWIKFYPRDWRGDQALRLVSIQARGLWIEMLCIMHEASPYGHLLIGDQPVSSADLARVVGSSVEEVQAMLVELSAAGVSRQTRQGVVYSKRMLDDHKRSVIGRKAKEKALSEASESKGKKPAPSRSPTRTPTTQKPEARVELEGPNSPSSLYEGKIDFLGPKEIRQAFEERFGDEWCRSYIDPCQWQDVPERALIPANAYAANKIIREGRVILAKLGLAILDRAQRSA